MTQLSPSAAYIRKGELSDQPSLRADDLRGAVIEEQVWALLETPQTIDSLQRAASRIDVGRETQTNRSDIETMLERLLDADLIELSSDS